MSEGLHQKNHIRWQWIQSVPCISHLLSQFGLYFLSKRMSFILEQFDKIWVNALCISIWMPHHHSHRTPIIFTTHCRYSFNCYLFILHDYWWLYVAIQYPNFCNIPVLYRQKRGTTFLLICLLSFTYKLITYALIYSIFFMVVM